MRHFSPIAIAFLGACAAFNAHAAADGSDPCTLLDLKDLQPFGAVKDTALVNAGWHQEKSPKELPGSRLFTNMCAVAIDSDAGRSSITLSFDSFKGKVTEQQVGDWLKSIAASDADAPEVSIVRNGDTTCESGQYALPTTNKKDGTVADIVEHYIACDKQVGTQHVSLNVHVPEGKKASLPTPEETRALLEKSVNRMKQKTFIVPNSAPNKST